MVKINFKGLVAQYKNRFRLLPVAGAANLYDLVPERGTVTQEGDEITAEAMNQMQDNVEFAMVETFGNELYGDVFRFGYEIGGFEANKGESNTLKRARPVDKAIFVRKGMRVTGGGTYQVQVVEVDSTGTAGEYLCFYANEYVAQADGYIRYTVKSIANPDTELTEADLPLIAEKVVIRKDDNVDKRIGTLAETVNNELYGEALHLEYEVGGFDASLGQVNTKVRARPVDKAIFVRKGMRITGGGT